jgi:hypothetical protein
MFQSKRHRKDLTNTKVKEGQSDGDLILTGVIAYIRNKDIRDITYTA